jgi:DNA-binding IclR family transcriptional regulator
MPPIPPGAPRSVTSRVLAVLGAFTAERATLGVSEISRYTGLPLTTAHRLVRELVRWGALERDDAGRYHVGLRLWEVGSLAPRGVGLREAALPFMEDLYEITHQNIQLAVLDGAEVVYVERLSGPRAVRVITRPGSRLPLHATGVGQVLLAHAERELQEQVLAAPLGAFTGRTVTDPAALRRVLAAVRREGVAVCHGQVETFSLSVAAPVYGPADTVVAALSVVVPAEGTDARTIVPPVRASARGISRALGWTGRQR